MHDTPPHTPPTPLVPVDPPDPSAILRAPIAFKRRAFNNPSNPTTFPVEVSNAGSMSDGMDEWPFYDLTIEEVEEKKTKKKTIKCSACGQPGHNKASKKCPKFPVDIRPVAPPLNEITQSTLCPSEVTTVSSSDVVLNSSQFEVSKCRNCLFCNQLFRSFFFWTSFTLL
ncbi:hypothetical protein RCL1_002357 [Eukaryota sp. TZLM3-RCL]